MSFALPIRLATAAAVVVLLCAGAASAQTPRHPRKRPDVVQQGMTPAQVRAILGEPVAVRHDGGLTYMEYPSGCAGCRRDFVVVRDCRVVGGQFERPDRLVLRSAVPDTSAPPPAECRASAAEPEPPAAAVAAPFAAVTPAVAPAPASVPAQDAGPAPLAAPVARVAAMADTGSCRLPLDPRYAQLGPPPAEPPPPLAERELRPGDAREWRRDLALGHPATHLVALPAATIASPTAFGVQMGEAFVGATYQARTRFTHVRDGAGVIGVGLGDRDRYVGLEVALTSYSTLRGGGPLQTGGVSFKLHRALGPDWGIAAGVENAVLWGGSDTGRSPYLVTTRDFHLTADDTRPFSSIAATLGVGGGRFRSEQQIVNDRKTANVFGALGIQILQPVALTADWSGQDLLAGVSVTPIRRIPLVINAGWADLTRNAGDGPRFYVSAGLGFRWLPPYL